MAIAIFFVPDSPVYLIRQGKESAARKSLEWLRGKEYIEIDEEISAIKKSEAEINDPESRISLGQLFSNAVYLKPFALSLVLMILQQFSGINQVLFYLQLIFQKAGSSMDQGLSGFITASMQVGLKTGIAKCLMGLTSNQNYLIYYKSLFSIQSSIVGFDIRWLVLVWQFY